MKKIIFAALSVLMMLSLVGCGEHFVDFKVVDLSNGAVPGDWAIPANWDNTTPFTSVDKDTNTYTFEFTVKDDLAAGSDIGFKILTVSGNWDVAGYTEFEVTVDGDAATANYKDNCGPAGNAFVKGCEAGKTYKMTVVCNADSSATVKVESMEDPVYPTPFYLDGIYLVGCGAIDNNFSFVTGNLLWGAETDITTGKVTYTKDFTVVGCSDDWHEGDAAIKLSDSNWAVSYGKTSITVNEDYVELEASGDNSVVSGLDAGKAYRLYVETTPEGKVFAKIVTLNKVTISTATVTATGLPEALNGTTLYFTGDFNGWAAPGADGTIEGTVTDGVITITLPEFSKDFEGSEPQEFAVSGKFANTGWTKPEICAAEGNINFTLTPEKYTLKGTYKSDDGEVYVCDWVVE